MNDYAVIRSGGKQYRVQVGDTIKVGSLAAPVGDTVELNDVLLLSQDGDMAVGTPTVPNAKVVAEVTESGKDPKIVVFKFKAKTRYRRKTGHRQLFTKLRIKDIAKYPETPTPKTRTRKKAEVTESGS